MNMIPQNIPYDKPLVPSDRILIHVYPHKSFNNYMYSYGWHSDAQNVPDNVACISIGCTHDIQENYLRNHKHEYDEHWFKQDSYNVINLDFDDIVMEYMETKYGIAYGITDEQASKLVKFIKDNFETAKYWYIHCRSGKSRSVAVGSFINDLYINANKQTMLFLPHGDAGLNQFVMQKLLEANKA